MIDSSDRQQSLPGQIVPRELLFGIGAMAIVGIAGMLIYALFGWIGGSDDPEYPDSLQLVVGGIPSELPGSVPIRGTTSAAFTLLPSGDRFVRTLDIYLSDPRTGVAVTEEYQIEAVATMRFMDHESFVAAAISSGDGHFRIPLKFSMGGEWQIDLTFSTPTGPAGLALFVELWN